MSRTPTGAQAGLTNSSRSYGYAYSVGSIPMLMTHGQTLIEQPEFLERLVVEGGLAADSPCTWT